MSDEGRALALQDDLDVVYVRSAHELGDTFGVGGKVELGLRFLNLGLSAEARYATSDQFSSASSFVVVKRESYDEPESLSRVRLTPEALTLLRRDRVAFLSRCGDSFIEARVRGRRFFGVVEFTKTSSALRREFGGSIGASWLTGGAELSHQFTNRIKSESESLKFTILANGDARQLPNPDDFISFAQQALQTQDGASGRTPVAFVTQSYEVAENFPVDVSYPSIQHQVRFLEQLASWRTKYGVKARDIELLGDSVNSCARGRQRRASQLKRIQRDIALIDQAGKQCASSPGQPRCAPPKVRLDLRSYDEFLRECSSRAADTAREQQRQESCRGQEQQGCPPCSKWEFTKLDYKAPTRKLSGGAWDADGSGPDLVLSLQAGGGTRTSEKREGLRFSWTLSSPIQIGVGEPVLLRAVDKDLMADDLVETLHGQVGERLKGGALVLGSGSAVLQGRCIE